MYVPVRFPFSTDPSTKKSAIKGPGSVKLEKSVLGYVVAALFQNPNWISNPVAPKSGRRTFLNTLC